MYKKPIISTEQIKEIADTLLEMGEPMGAAAGGPTPSQIASQVIHSHANGEPPLMEGLMSLLSALQRYGHTSDQSVRAAIKSFDMLHPTARLLDSLHYQGYTKAAPATPAAPPAHQTPIEPSIPEDEPPSQ